MTKKSKIDKIREIMNKTRKLDILLDAWSDEDLRQLAEIQDKHKGTAHPKITDQEAEHLNLLIEKYFNHDQQKG